MANITLQEVELYLDARTAESWAAVTRVIPKGFPARKLSETENFA